MKMNEQHYLPCPICGQSCKAEVALGYAEKSSVRNVVVFGHGFYGVDIGTLGDHPAVFIIPNDKPGPVGERVPLDLQIPLEREVLPDDWTVLLFPTRDRCKEVADALVGSKMVQWKNDPIQSAAPGGGTDVVEGSFWDGNEKVTGSIQVPSDPAQEPEAVTVSEIIREVQPATAANPNESAYERGKFDGVMETLRALRDVLSTFNITRKP